MDALCEWERNAGRHSTLILIPHNYDENIVLVEDGKPLTGLLDDEHPLRFLIDAALGDRLSSSRVSFNTNRADIPDKSTSP